MEQNQKIYQFAESIFGETFKKIICGNDLKIHNSCDEFYLEREFVKERFSEWGKKPGSVNAPVRNIYTFNAEKRSNCEHILLGQNLLGAYQVPLCLHGRNYLN